MKQILLAAAAFILLFSCKKDENPTPAPDQGFEMQHPDWYILRAPDNREIQAVYGDIDGTLLITDRFRIYYTNDRGKTWNQADYNTGIGLAGFTSRNDTLFVLDTETSTTADPGNRYASRPYYFSVDGGIKWQKLARSADYLDMKKPINFAHSGNGIRFSIDKVYDSFGNSEDLGVKSESGRRIGLPWKHQLSSVYFDGKSRLHITASAPLCDKNGKVDFCGDKDYRGTLYISKKPVDY
ncbi:hypothetical protein GCM10010967_29690 [Dyadobacter beijingensis]|uniref:Exo-alpha-sialidase n=1 Tax=Dyadobacter beijingensis TaxID=365489 RepID=A0ABQ2HXF5_9BACT|nr:hypothetical protein [Dyadobacter beijingensis]GGM94493.1 hypothetical protein GCM10010967_29690 [Dyadobacter beijingensis]